MITPTQLRNDVAKIIANGNQFRFRYFSVTDTGSYYDDSYAYAQSGTDVWVSGLMQPITSPQGSYEAQLLEQGRLTTNDSRLYVLGTVNTSGIITIGCGSPVDRVFQLPSDNVQAWELGSEVVYKKIFMRYLPTGSLR